MEVKINGVWADITSGDVIISGVQRSLIRAEYYDGSAWKEVLRFTDTLTAAITGDGYAYGASSGATSATTGNVTATPTGGLGPYTYSWALVSSTGGDSTVIANSTQATTTFSKPNIPAYTIYTDIFRVTITDYFGATATADFSIIFENLGSLS